MTADEFPGNTLDPQSLHKYLDAKFLSLRAKRSSLIPPKALDCFGLKASQ
jgi:hypothetical protein